MTASVDPRSNDCSRPFTPRTVFTIVALLELLALLPVYSLLTGDTFVLTLFTRVLILAIGAVSLNLIMGYGGMVSFGPRRLSRHRRLRGGHPGEGGDRLWIRSMAGGDCSLGACTRWWSARSACARAASISS